MFSGFRASVAGDYSDSDCESETAVMINGQERIRGENGTYMLSSTGNALLDAFSSSTRIDASKLNRGEVQQFNNKLDAALAHTGDDVARVDVVKHFAAFCYYTRDVNEKGERTLFDLAFIRLWNYDSKLAKLLVKFIVGNNDVEHFGSWKDLHQILALASSTELGLMSDENYDEMFRFFIEFEGDQLLKDWIEFVESRKSGKKPDLSLLAKWLVGARKSFDEKLERNGKSFLANFCEINAGRISQMSQIAHDAKLGATASSEFGGWKHKVNASNFIGLQKVIRKVKSALNAELETPEQKMCANKWSDIDIGHVPARNMTKHRRAFNAEKAEHDRKTAFFDSDEHPYGDRFSIPDEYESIREKLDALKEQVTDPAYAEKVAEFWADDEVRDACAASTGLRKVLDRIVCRFNVSSTLVGPGKKSIKGARSDLNDLVTAAWKIRNGNQSFDPANMAAWAGSNADRAVLHAQAQDKIREISEAIEKALAEEIGPDGVRINLKKVMGLFDVSGSMESGSGSVKPMDICVGMAYFISQLTRHQHVDEETGEIVVEEPLGITFEERPQFFQIPGNMDFVSALHYIKGRPWGGSTNFQAAYELILHRAIRYKMDQSQLPEVLMVFSDMQFNQANGRASRFETMYETIKRQFEAAGYQLPLLVFWNLNGKYAGQSVGGDCPGVITISGYDPAIFKTIAECGSLVTKDVVTGKVTAASPMEVMIKSLTRERYQPIIKVVTDYFAGDASADAVATGVCLEHSVTGAVALDMASLNMATKAGTSSDA